MHRSLTGNSTEVDAPAPVQRDTIAAISTPPGEGAIALIRISGRDAIEIADKIFRGKEKPSEFPSHAQRLGQIVENDKLVDQVMLSVHRAPRVTPAKIWSRSVVTAESLVSARVLETCLHAGARAAGRVNLPSAPFTTARWTSRRPRPSSI